MLFMLDELHCICFLDSWIGIVIPICFGSCLIVSALFRVKGAIGSAAYHLIDRQASSS